jgi:hypothetical protein
MNANNLMPSGGNAYWQVSESFPAYVHRGVAASNTYVGSSMVYAKLWEQMDLPVGTIIYALVGGTFAALDGRLYRVAIQLSFKHPFERTYLPSSPTWPLDRLTRTDKHELLPRAGEAVMAREELAALGAQQYGRSIDWVYAAKETVA